MVTWAPSLTNWRAISDPVPRDAPVTIVTLPSSLPISAPSYGVRTDECLLPRRGPNPASSPASGPHGASGGERRSRRSQSWARTVVTLSELAPLGAVCAHGHVDVALQPGPSRS